MDETRYQAARVDRPRQVVERPFCDLHGARVNAAVLHYYVPAENRDFDICEDCLEAGLKKIRESEGNDDNHQSV